MLDRYKPDLVIFEKPLATIAGKTNFITKYKLGGLAFLTELRCFREDVRCTWIGNSEIKKHFVGHGGFGKKTQPYPMIVAAHQRGWEVTNDDEADACGLWSYAVACYAPEHACLHDPLMRGGEAA